RRRRRRALPVRSPGWQRRWPGRRRRWQQGHELSSRDTLQTRLLLGRLSELLFVGRLRLRLCRRVAVVGAATAAPPERPAVDLDGADGGAEVAVAIVRTIGRRAAMAPVTARRLGALVLDEAVDDRGAGVTGGSGAGQCGAGVGASRRRLRRAGAAAPHA